MQPQRICAALPAAAALCFKLSVMLSVLKSVPWHPRASHTGCRQARAVLAGDSCSANMDSTAGWCIHFRAKNGTVRRAGKSIIQMPLRALNDRWWSSICRVRFTVVTDFPVFLLWSWAWQLFIKEVWWCWWCWWCECMLGWWVERRATAAVRSARPRVCQSLLSRRRRVRWRSTAALCVTRRQRRHHWHQRQHPTVRQVNNYHRNHGFYVPARWEAGNKRCFCPSVRLSVFPSVAYIANNSRTQRPSVSKFGRKVPHLRCHSRTSFKVKRSKVRVTGGLGHTVSAEPGGHTAWVLV